MKNSISSEKEEQLKSKFEKRREIIVSVYKMITKAKVEWLLSLECYVDEYDKETDIVQRTLKKTVFLIIWWLDIDQIKKILEFDRCIALKWNKLDEESIELLFLIETISTAIHKCDIDELFKLATFANKYLIQERWDECNVVRDLVHDIEKERIRLLQWNTEYPITLDEWYKEFKANFDNKMKVFEHLWDREIQKFIRETQSNDLENVLWMCSKQLRHKFIKNISQRAGEMIDHWTEILYYWLEWCSITFEKIDNSMNKLLKTLNWLE